MSNIKVPRTCAKAPTRLVCIQGNTYVAYSGKDRLEIAPFDRPLQAEEVEYFRKYPKKFVESLEVLEVDSQDNSFENQPELA